MYIISNIMEWSQTRQKSINFFYVTVSLIDSQIEIDLYVKPTHSHQYLHSSLLLCCVTKYLYTFFYALFYSAL